MRGKVLLVMLVFSLLSIGLTMALTGACSDQPNFESLVCGGSPDSVTGFGAVEICGNCYPCGVNDSVCPEDFYSTVTQTQGNCRLCPDPDCPATLSGYVFEKGLPVPNTDIVAVYNSDNNIGTRTIIGKTNQTGEYSGTIPSGFHTLFTQFGTFQGPNEELEISRGQHIQYNFTINRGTCNSDCTVGTTGLCSAGCNNIEGCVFPNNISLGFSSDLIASRCDGLDGTGDDKSTIKLGVIGDYTYRFTCCTGSFTSNKAVELVPAPANPKTIKNSASWRTPVTWNDEPVFFNILFGK